MEGMEVLGLWFATWRWVSMSPLHLNDGSLEEVTSYSENANCVRCSIGVVEALEKKSWYEYVYVNGD